jgi:hypothetical protein
VSSPPFPDRRPDGGHPDRGALADEIAGVAAPAVADHLLGCRSCTARLAELTTASTSVARDLRADPEPELPAALAVRFAEVIAKESAARRAATDPVVATPDRPPLRSARARVGWWARHTRLGGALVTASALVVVGGGGAVAAHWVQSGQPTHQAASSGSPHAEAQAPSTDLRARVTPPAAAAGPIALHRSTFAGEVASILSSRNRAITPRRLTSTQQTCIAQVLGQPRRAGATALPGVVTVDGKPVLLVLTGSTGTRTAVAISGCSAGDPRVVARGNVP